MTEKYFKSLNYSLANEDTWPEVRMVLKLKPKRVLSVAGSGGRALPLVAADPEQLICVDLSKEQLGLVYLRQETIKHFSHSDFLLFWGYPPYFVPEHRLKRKSLFQRLTLPADDHEFFLNLFETLNWDAILYQGKWEKTFSLFSNVPRTLLGKKLLEESLNCQTVSEQEEFFKKKLPKWRWDMVFRILGNATVFNAFLYKGHFVKKNVPENHFDYYRNAFSRIFKQTLIRKNFFAQLCFFGEIVTTEAIPVEGDAEVFERMKEWLLSHEAPLHLQGNILEIIPQNSVVKDIDFFSFSDVPSYFQGEVEKNFLQMVRPKMSLGGIIVVRNYLRVPENTDLTGYEDVSHEYAEDFYDEKVQMYMVSVYKRVS